MRGGKRPGAGRKKGSKDPQTLGKEQARELARQHITERLIPLLDSAIDHALGIRHFFKRNDAGQWERLTDPDQITEAMNKGEGFWIYTKDPSVHALKELLDRALDKPAAPVELTGDDKGPVVFRWLE
jgi:hypothetical protein